jgi:mono/diheme cytochrome c family protein
MSMKRCFELPVSPSFSLLGRAVLVGSVLSFAAACARKDAGKSDSAAAASDSVTTSASSMTATASSPVESASTGETTVSAESKANPSVAATKVASGEANTAAKATTSTATTASPAHHTAHRADSGTTKHAAPTAASASTARAASADTGQKTAADTSKKTAAAGGSSDHLLVSPQEYEGWKMFSVYCYRCHGVDAMGGGIAPNLRHSVSSEGSVTHDVFITTVTNGRLDKGMPTWKALLTPEQMEDLWLYVNARSSGRLAPGRPHMASGANP